MTFLSRKQTMKKAVVASKKHSIKPLQTQQRVWEAKARRSSVNLIEDDDVDETVEAHMSLIPITTDFTPIPLDHFTDFTPIPLENHDISWEVECNEDDFDWGRLIRVCSDC